MIILKLQRANSVVSGLHRERQRQRERERERGGGGGGGRESKREKKGVRNDTVHRESEGEGRRERGR